MKSAERTANIPKLFLNVPHNTSRMLSYNNHAKGEVKKSGKKHCLYCFRGLKYFSGEWFWPLGRIVDHASEGSFGAFLGHVARARPWRLGRPSREDWCSLNPSWWCPGSPPLRISVTVQIYNSSGGRSTGEFFPTRLILAHWVELILSIQLHTLRILDPFFNHHWITFLVGQNNPNKSLCMLLHVLRRRKGWTGIHSKTCLGIEKNVVVLNYWG